MQIEFIKNNELKNILFSIEKLLFPLSFRVINNSLLLDINITTNMSKKPITIAKISLYLKFDTKRNKVETKKYAIQTDKAGEKIIASATLNNITNEKVSYIKNMMVAGSNTKREENIALKYIIIKLQRKILCFLIGNGVNISLSLSENIML